MDICFKAGVSKLFIKGATIENLSFQASLKKQLKFLNCHLRGQLNSHGIA